MLGGDGDLVGHVAVRGRDRHHVVFPIARKPAEDADLGVKQGLHPVRFAADVCITGGRQQELVHDAPLADADEQPRGPDDELVSQPRMMRVGRFDVRHRAAPAARPGLSVSQVALPKPLAG